MKHNNKRMDRIVGVVLGMALVVLLSPVYMAWCAGPVESKPAESQPAVAAPPAPEPAAAQPVTQNRYDPKGKADPFKPFIEIKTEAEKKADKKEQAEKSKLLPPLERYGLEEFKLIGIVWNQTRRVAMVEDSGGKTYAITEGMKIGLNEGKVEKILPDQVIVSEKVRDAFDNVKLEQAILKIKSEENEGEL